MHVDLRSRFIEFYHNELSFHSTFERMRSTVEDSPWHREANVGVHTDMVVAEYISRSPEVWNERDVVGAMACAFHDFGKPDAEETVWREDRGDYRRYTGHEKMSARLFESWAAENFGRIEYLGLDVTDIYKITWLCEHHLPWGVRKPLKREALALTSLFIDDYTDDNILERVLLSDTWGRISDDAETKHANALAWVEEFVTFKAEVNAKRLEGPIVKPKRPRLFIAIGAPACGKSTFRDELDQDENFGDVLIHNMDEMRIKFYLDPDIANVTDEDYDYAYQRSTEDKAFGSRVHQEFIQMIKTGKNIYGDNTNASAKRRAFYVTEARKKGYTVVAVLFPISLDECLERQKTRTDKTVPAFAVANLYNAIQMPQLGEFDMIRIVSSNL